MSWRTLSGAAPQVIAHRGASGLLPEHCMPGYALALEQGADVLEPDLVASADGVLFVRHDLGLDRSTDVAARAEFAARRRDGDWWCSDFAAAELDALRVRQPFPTRTREYDGLHAPPRFADLVTWTAAASAREGRTLTLYPELKHPSDFAARGIDIVALFLAAIRRLPQGVALRVQCFEADALRRVREGCDWPCVLLLDAQADVAAAIAEHGSWLSGLGTAKTLLLDPQRGDTGALDRAHSAGLFVDAWTFRDDMVGAGWPSIEAELEAAMRLGIDGLFCDFPATAIAVRERLIQAGARGSR